MPPPKWSSRMGTHLHPSKGEWRVREMEIKKIERKKISKNSELLKDIVALR